MCLCMKSAQYLTYLDSCLFLFILIILFLSIYILLHIFNANVFSFFKFSFSSNLTLTFLDSGLVLFPVALGVGGLPGWLCCWQGLAGLGKLPHIHLYQWFPNFLCPRHSKGQVKCSRHTYCAKQPSYHVLSFISYLLM